MVTRTDIRRYARRLAEEFQPRKIILFGSYARGNAGDDSDVDLLVVMDRLGDGDEEAVQMRLRVPRSFPVDLLVKRASEVKRRAARGDSFMRTVLSEGRLLYER